MDKFFHIRIIIGIILGLSVTHMLKGGVRFIQHPGRQQAYWIHLLWAFYIFLLLIHFWWWEFHLTRVTEWTFILYFFLISYVIVFFILAAILFPDDLKDYKRFKEYFFSRKKWFFGVLAFSFAVDIGDTLLKGGEYMQGLGTEYIIRNSVHFTLCLIAIPAKSTWFHGILVSLFILYEFSYIVRLFNIL